MIALIWIGSVLAYILPAMLVYRVQYRKAYTGYLRWKNEKPEALHEMYHEYRYSPIARKDFTWYQYQMSILGEGTPLTLAIGWPFLWLKYLNKFLHPQVKIPDVAKITELDKLSEKYFDEDLLIEGT